MTVQNKEPGSVEILRRYDELEEAEADLLMCAENGERVPYDTVRWMLADAIAALRAPHQAPDSVEALAVELRQRFAHLLHPNLELDWRHEASGILTFLSQAAEQGEPFAERVLSTRDSFCPGCGHNRDAGSVSSIDEGGAYSSCQMCGTVWREAIIGNGPRPQPSPPQAECACPSHWDNGLVKDHEEGCPKDLWQMKRPQAEEE